MSEFKMSGRIAVKLEPKSGQGKNGIWRSQDFVIEETTGNYPKKGCFNVYGDKVDLLTHLKIGDMITVHFNVDASEWQGKWFPKLSAWKIEQGAGGQAAPTQQAAAAPAPTYTPPPPGRVHDSMLPHMPIATPGTAADDIPF